MGRIDISHYFIIYGHNAIPLFVFLCVGIHHSWAGILLLGIPVCIPPCHEAKAFAEKGAVLGHAALEIRAASQDGAVMWGLVVVVNGYVYIMMAKYDYWPIAVMYSLRR